MLTNKIRYRLGVLGYICMTISAIIHVIAKDFTPKGIPFLISIWILFTFEHFLILTAIKKGDKS